MRGVCTLLVQVGVVLGVVATSLRRKILEQCRRRLTTWREACTMNSEGELLPVLTSLLMAKRMVTIGANQELLLASLSYMMKTIIISAETEIHLREEWGTTLWVKHSTKSPSHLSRAGLKEGDFLGGSLSPHSPCTMVEQTLWNMLATSIKRWLYTPRTRLCCARFSHPAGAYSDEVVWWSKGKFHWFLQGTHSSIWIPLYYVQQGSSAFSFLVVFIHKRRRNHENIFRQILGDVQRDKQWFWRCSHKHFQAWPTRRAWLKEVFD